LAVWAVSLHIRVQNKHMIGAAAGIIVRANVMFDIERRAKEEILHPRLKFGFVGAHEVILEIVA
jgi:hypothetical protein